MASRWRRSQIKGGIRFHSVRMHFLMLHIPEFSAAITHVNYLLKKIKTEFPRLKQDGRSEEWEKKGTFSVQEEKPYSIKDDINKNN